MLKNMFKEFRDFAMRGNMLDLAIGIVIGAAFTSVVNSLVKDIMTPPIGWVLGGIDFSSIYINLSGGSYPSLAAATAAGAATINVGLFLNALINFIIVAFVLFLIIKQINVLMPKKVEPPSTKDCPYCQSKIAIKATRCPQCTSQLEEPAKGA
jgi:large conductance mechanosensitive channel